MTTATGFAMGVGAVAVAICVGFSGGYMLTKTDTANKIPPAMAGGGSSSPASSTPPIAASDTQPPQQATAQAAPALIKPAAASTIGLASAEIPHALNVQAASISHQVAEPAEKAEKPENATIPKTRVTKKSRSNRPVVQAADLGAVEEAIEADIHRKVGRISDNSLP